MVYSADETADPSNTIYNALLHQGTLEKGSHMGVEECCLPAKIRVDACTPIDEAKKALEHAWEQIFCAEECPATFSFLDSAKFDYPLSVHSGLAGLDEMFQLIEEHLPSPTCSSPVVCGELLGAAEDLFGFQVVITSTDGCFKETAPGAGFSGRVYTVDGMIHEVQPPGYLSYLWKSLEKVDKDCSLPKPTVPPMTTVPDLEEDHPPVQTVKPPKMCKKPPPGYWANLKNSKLRKLIGVDEC
eukprot:Trichotokara_eunicae@DN6103_c0_g2_i1.p1